MSGEWLKWRLLLQKIFMSHDAGFILDFRVRLPTPTPCATFFFFALFDPLFNSETEKRFNTVPERRFENILDIHDFKRLFRVEVQLSHRRFRAEIAAADATWQ